MKLTTLLMAVFLTSVSNIALALDAPEPFEPNDGEVFDKNTAATFSWNKVSGATKYQLVFGTDDSFSSFDNKKNKCSNKNTCATFTVSKISYKLAKTHAFMKKDGSYFWKIRSYKGTTKSAFSDSYQFHVGEPVEETTIPSTTKGDVETFKSGDRTFSYTKIANDGSELPKTAKLGTGAKDWACTKDNNTGLIWEVKTDDGGLRDKDNRYSWYEPNSSKNSGFEGYKNNSYYKNANACSGSECDTYAFTNAVNKKDLCGATDWRIPTAQELRGLVYCSDGKYNTVADEQFEYVCSNFTLYYLLSKAETSLNPIYFINTPNPEISDKAYWTSSHNKKEAENGINIYAIAIEAGGGFNSSYYKRYGNFVRLVRNGK